MSIYRGGIFYIERADTVGSEQKANRPAIIVSNNLNNKYSQVVEVVYLTTQQKKPLPTHVPINSAKYPGTALCEQVHSVAVERLGDCIGHCTPAELALIDAALCTSLGLPTGGEASQPVPPAPVSSDPIADASALDELIAVKAQLAMLRELYNDLLLQRVRSA